LTQTDAGLVAIGARFSAAAGAGLGAGADGALGMLSPGRPCNPIRQIPLYATSLGGSGTVASAATLGPSTAQYWSVRRLSASGFTAGTVVFCLNSAAGEPVAVFAGAAGQIAPQTFGRGELLLHPQSFLVPVASGITGTVTIIGAADMFPDWYLSEYLG
jgi:hypothetical protein